MRLHYGPQGQFRGYSMGAGTRLLATALLVVFALAGLYMAWKLLPVLAVFALAIWAVRSEIRRHRRPRA